MNLPNLLSLSRIPLLFLIVAALQLSQFFEGKAAIITALLLFMIASLTDWFDGYLARRAGVVSDFGKCIDPITDKFLVIGVLIGMQTVSLLPDWSLWIILLILLRELMVTALRQIASYKGQILSSAKDGKWKAGLQMFAICLIMVAQAIEAQESGLASVLDQLGLLLLIGATGLGLTSGIRYWLEYALKRRHP